MVTSHSFPMYSGIPAINIEMKSPIPSRLYLAGYKAFTARNGQQQSCFNCNKTTRIKVVQQDWDAPRHVKIPHPSCLHVNTINPEIEKKYQARKGIVHTHCKGQPHSRR